MAKATHRENSLGIGEEIAKSDLRNTTVRLTKKNRMSRVKVFEKIKLESMITQLRGVIDSICVSLVYQVNSNLSLIVKQRVTDVSQSMFYKKIFSYA